MFARGGARVIRAFPPPAVARIRRVVALAGALAGALLTLVPDAGLHAATPIPGEMFMVSGRYVGDGVSPHAITGLGFTPDLVLVKGPKGTPTAIRVTPMSGVNSKLLGVAAATTSQLIRSLDTGGFTLGSDVAVNEAGVVYDWVAFKAAANRMVIGSYTGDGVDNRTLNIGMRPDYLMVISDKAYQAVQRFVDQVGDASFTFADGATLANEIQSFAGNGFVVGNADEVNKSLTTYYYVGWKAIVGRIQVGSYAGDGADDRVITTPVLTPYTLLLTSGAALRAPIQRLAPVLGDKTYPTGSGAGFADGIQRRLATGFEVGTDPRANALGVTHYWVALQNPQDADLDVRTTANKSTAALADTVTFTTVLTNHGPAAGNTVTVQTLLPPGFSLVSATPSKGTYSGTGGSWAVGAMASSEVATLQLAAIAGLAAVGKTAAQRSSAAQTSPLDIYDANSVDSAWVHVTGADIAVAAGTNDLTPTAGVEADFSVDVSNTGPDAVSALVLRDSLAGFTRGGWSASQGTFDPSSGQWDVGALTSGQTVTLRYAAAPNAGTQGATVQRMARVLSASLPDPDPADDAATSNLRIVDPVMLVRSGSYIGNGAARVIPGVGFQPDLLFIKGAGGSSAIVRTRTMAADAAKELGTTNALLTGRVTGLNADGFALGTDASVNASGLLYQWVAFVEAPGQLRVGAYTGDALDNRSFAGAGFQPDYVMILGGVARHAVQRFPAQTGDATVAFESGSEATNRIQRFDPDGFQIGSDSDVNGAGSAYHYACWNAMPAVAGGGLYAGDGLDDRNLDALAFQPGFMLAMRKESGSGAVTRTQSVTGDLTLPAFGAAPFANGVQALRPGGFQIGSDGTVNAANKNYFYFGVRDATGADLIVESGLIGLPPDEGDTLRILVTVRNQGPETASAVVVSDPVPANTSYGASLATQGSYDGFAGTWTVGTLAPGATAGLALGFVVGPGAAGTFITNMATASSALADPFVPNNADTLSVPVRMVDLTLDLTADDATPTQNEEVAFTLKLTNHGPFVAHAVQVQAPLPAALTYHSHTPSLGAYSPTTGIWSVDPLPVGATATLIVRAASAAAPGTVVDLPMTILTATEVDPNPGDNSDATSVILQRPEFRIVTGRYVGDGNAGRVIGGAGFQPDLLLIKGEGATPTIMRVKGMPDDRAKPLGEATALVAGRVTGVTPDGFVLGADAAVNAPGVTYHWTAFLEAPGELRVGTYVGDGVDNRSITGLGFQPGYLIVATDAGKRAIQRFAGEVGDASLPFEALDEVRDRIQRIDPDGFQIGKDADVNTIGAVHYFVAWNGAHPRVRNGLYLGNGIAGRPIDGVGFRPTYVAIKRLDNVQGVQRPASITTDLTLPAPAAVAFANGIRGFLADGFELGSNSAVNANGKVHAWVAFRDVPRVDLKVSIAPSDSIPNLGDPVTVTVGVRNLGPEDATGIAVSHLLPAGLTYTTHVPSHGVYNPATGVWTVGALVFGDSAKLDVVGTVDAGTGGTTLTATTFISASDQGDLNAINDEATALIRVQSTDLALRLIADPASLLEGQTASFLLTVSNHGPDGANSVVVHHALPVGMTFVQATPQQGSYAPANGTWTVGTIARGDSVQLKLQATTNLGTAGQTLMDVANITSVRQSDPQSANNADTVAIYVAYGPGILVTAEHGAQRALPGEVNAPLLELTVRNSDVDHRVLQGFTLTNRTFGPGPAATRDHELGNLALYADDGDDHFGPGDALLMETAATSGTVVFNGLSVPVKAGARVLLHVVTTVPIDARDGDSLDVAIQAATDVQYDLAVTPLNAWPVSPPGGLGVDGMSAAQLTTFATGEKALLGGGRQLAFDVLLPPNGYEPDILQGLTIVNRGDATATDLKKIEFFGDGGNGHFDGGTEDDFPIALATGADSVWTATGLSLPITLSGRRVFASMVVAADARSGATVQFALRGGTAPGVTVASGNDGPVDRDVTSPDLIVLVPGPSAFDVTSLPQNPGPIAPGIADFELFAFEVTNQSAYAETLTTVTMTNATIGPGTPDQLDADWLPLQLVADGSVVGSASFSHGRARFEKLSVRVPAGATLPLQVTSGASLVARDGDLLDLKLLQPADLEFSRTVAPTGTWPLHPVGSFPVDGMSAAQVTVGSQAHSDMLTGAVRALAFDAVLPPNGYQADTLRFLMTRNVGSAMPTADVSRIEAWVDDGDGVFEPAGTAPDALLGECRLSGGSWVLAGIVAPVPAGGLRLFLSCDIAAGATEGRTVQLSLPSYPVVGIGMASPNDGPRDQAVVNPTPMPIATADRMTLTAPSMVQGTVAPGDTNVVLLRLVARNRYVSTSRTLSSVSVRNLTSDPLGGNPVQLDAQLRRLDLRDGDNGPVVASALFSAGRATFTSLALVIPAGEERELVVTAAVAGNAADGALLGLDIEDESGVQFAEPTALLAGFPLDSDARWTVDGMVAAQIVRTGGYATAIAPGEGPIPVLQLLLRRNGFHDDTFEQIKLVNGGTATPADLDEVRLWRDGGNGQFDAVGFGDDVDLGPMSFVAGRWQGPIVTEAVGADGITLFASVTAAATAADSATIEFQVPVNGINMVSGNDGPIDQAVPGSDVILISQSGLLASLAPERPASVVGDLLIVRMTVRNLGGLGVTGITPSPLAVVADTMLSVVSGPVPASLDLGAGERGEFAWTLRVDRPGPATFRALVTGTEIGTGLTVRSLEAVSSRHDGFAEATVLRLYPLQSMPATVRPGQAQVVPMSFTFTHPGGADESDILLTGLTLRLEDESGAGLIPAALLSRVVLSEGTSVYADMSSLPAVGATVRLTPVAPIRIRSGSGSSGQVTLNLAFDLSPTTAATSLRLVIQNSTSVSAEDAISSAPVTVNLEGGASYALASGLARILQGGSGLSVAGVPGTALEVGRGQAAVPLLSARVTNLDAPDLGADVRVSRLAVRLTDANGVALDHPSHVLDRIRVTSGGATLIDRALGAADDTLIVLGLTQVITIPPGANAVLDLSADVGQAADLGTVRLRLAPAGLFVARDAGGDTVAVSYEANPIEGADLTVRDRPDSLRASAIARMPVTVFLGATDVHAFDLVLAHPGPAQAAPVRCAGLTLRLRDQAGAPLSPASFLDRVSVVRHGVEVGAVGNLPALGGDFAIPLTGVVTAAAASETLEVHFAVEASASLVYLQMQVVAEGVDAHDALTGVPVAVAAAAGLEFPLASGIGKLEAPARELAAGFHESMPAMLVADSQPARVGRLTLRNTAPAGEILVDTLVTIASDRAYRGVPIGGAVTAVEAWIGDSLWAASAGIGATDPVVRLVGAAPILVAAGATVEVELRVAVREGTHPFRIGVTREGIVIDQPQSPLLAVALVSEEGQSFPFWSQSGSVGARSLEDSYANYPNPFAAGRTATIFTYYLPSAAHVTLHIRTARGEAVRTLLEDDSRPAGLQQRDVWDGLNGRGHPVTNGVYLAELVVRYENGSGTSLIRKVAVAR